MCEIIYIDKYLKNKKKQNLNKIEEVSFEELKTILNEIEKENITNNNELEKIFSQFNLVFDEENDLNFPF